VQGRVEELLVDQLHVPRDPQVPFAELPPRKYFLQYDETPEVRDWQPRYSLKVNWGSRLEPWIETATLNPTTEN